MVESMKRSAFAQTEDKRMRKRSKPKPHAPVDDFALFRREAYLKGVHDAEALAFADQYGCSPISAVKRIDRANAALMAGQRQSVDDVRWREARGDYEMSAELETMCNTLGFK